MVLFVHRAKERESFQLFSKNKRNLYATPSAGNEMVTLRSTSPSESEEARKKELEANNEIENFASAPVPQTESKTHSLLPSPPISTPPLSPPSVADRMKPISVDSFRDHVNKMHEERDKGFEVEYQVRPPPPLSLSLFLCCD